MPSEDFKEGFDEGWRAAMQRMAYNERVESIPTRNSPPSPKPKRKPSAANQAYSRAFAKVKGRFQTKSGKWKKNGFRNAVRAAHKLAKK